MAWWLIVLIILGALLFCIALYDTLQASDPILRNFPVVGHFRSLLSTSGPKLRQYIVAANDEDVAGGSSRPCERVGPAV